MRRQTQNLITHLARQESAFLRTQFLAPVAGNGVVQVRIAGALCRLTIQPRNFKGWGIFQPIDFTRAKLNRQATLSERQRYLRLFPPTRLILTQPRKTHWFAMAADASELVVHNVDDADRFDTVITRFDGARFWFDQRDPQGDPAAAAYLNNALTEMRDPRLLNRAGLTPQQRAGYAKVHNRRLAWRQTTLEQRLRLAIEHGGAQLQNFVEHPDSYRVTYAVDGTRHVSVVQKNDLSVASAGICLSGMDGQFDLASLVGVLREGQHRNEIRRNCST